MLFHIQNNDVSGDDENESEGEDGTDRRKSSKIARVFHPVIKAARHEEQEEEEEEEEDKEEEKEEKEEDNSEDVNDPHR